MEEVPWKDLPGKDIFIVFDRTGSMHEQINPFTNFMMKYVVRKVSLEEDSIRSVGLVAVDDHYVTLDDGYKETIMHEVNELMKETGRRGLVRFEGPASHFVCQTDNLEEFAYALRTLPIGHGVDNPEALACGWNIAAKYTSPEDIWIVTDTVPHGWYASDNYPDGCPCGVEIPDGQARVLLVKRRTASYWDMRGHKAVIVEDLEDEQLADRVIELEQQWERG